MASSTSACGSMLLLPFTFTNSCEAASGDNSDPISLIVQIKFKGVKQLVEQCTVLKLQQSPHHSLEETVLNIEQLQGMQFCAIEQVYDQQCNKYVTSCKCKARTIIV